MSTCNRLDLESLGSWPTMPKNFPGTAEDCCPQKEEENISYVGRMHISCDNRALKVLSVQMHWSRGQTDLQMLPWPQESAENMHTKNHNRPFIRHLCSQNLRWDSIMGGFSFEFLIVAQFMRAMRRRNQKNKKNQAWNVNGATFMRFQDAAFQDVHPVTCWYLTLFLDWFKIYSIDSSKMIVELPNSWTWAAYSTNPLAHL